ncbi:MAG: DnaJ domain-containing protein, partial [Myxococcota bacterium]|nr:DnaJ domain-containing protein [Myxococcota bacterium]
MRDHYRLLGLKAESTADEIKRAYRKKALQLHPDRNPSPDAARQFQALNEAYATLSDPQKREDYDRFGTRGGGQRSAPSGTVSPSELREIFGEDLFEELFASLLNERHRPAVKDLRVDLPISYQEAVQGGTLSRVVERIRRCDRCHGVGTESGRASPVCGACQGQGRVRMNRGFLAMMQRCEHCNGRGVMISDPCQG